jgi:Ca2+-binding EF-hand superfamily protein
MDLTEESVKKFFCRHYKTRDGYLDFNEIKELFKELCIKHNSEYNEKKVNALLKKLDKNKDGKISEDEFVEMFFSAKKVPNKIKKEVSDYFNSIDKNNDGFIDREELATAFNLVGNGLNYSKAYINGIFRYYDVNGDGKISLEEFASLEE